jgi:hypothetical protein
MKHLTIGQWKRMLALNLLTLLPASGCDSRTGVLLAINAEGMVIDQLRITAVESATKSSTLRSAPPDPSSSPLQLPATLMATFAPVSETVVFSVQAFYKQEPMATAQSQPIQLQPGHVVATTLSLIAAAPAVPMDASGGPTPTGSSDLASRDLALRDLGPVDLGASDLGSAPTGTATVATSEPAFVAGEPIVVSFNNGPGNEKDWIGVTPHSLQSYILWSYCGSAVPPYTPHTSSGALTAGTIALDAAALDAVLGKTWPIASGAYDVVFLSNNSYSQLAASRFYVDPGTCSVGGHPCSALQFSSTNDSYVDLGSALAIPADFTLEAWVYQTSVTGQQIIFSKDKPATTANQFRLGLDASRLFFTMAGADAYGVGTDTPFTTTLETVPQNTWTHVAVTKAGNTFALLINGASVATATTTKDVLHSGTMSARIGARNCCSDNSFNGIIDEVRLWDVPRSAAAITCAMHGEINSNDPQHAHLVDYWRFDENTGSNVNDSTGNHDGKLIHSPMWVASKAF